MRTQEQKLHAIEKWFIQKGFDFQSGENTDGEQVFVADWNNKNIPKNMEKFLENMDIILMYPDEALTCCHCYKIIDTKPHSYFDEGSYLILNDCEVICSKCSKENPSWVFEDYKNDFNKALKSDFPESFLNEQGFKKYNDEPYETGLHYGMNDSPESIIKKLEKEFKYYFDYIFKMAEKSQFYIRYNLYIKKDIEEK